MNKQTREVPEREAARPRIDTAPLFGVTSQRSFAVGKARFGRTAGGIQAGHRSPGVPGFVIRDRFSQENGRTPGLLVDVRGALRRCTAIAASDPAGTH
jgi:hypothetical protein